MLPAQSNCMRVQSACAQSVGTAPVATGDADAGDALHADTSSSSVRISASSNICVANPGGRRLYERRRRVWRMVVYPQLCMVKDGGEARRPPPVVTTTPC